MPIILTDYNGSIFISLTLSLVSKAACSSSFMIAIHKELKIIILY